MDSSRAGAGTPKDTIASVEIYHDTIYRILTKYRDTTASGAIGESVKAFVGAVVMASTAMEAAQDILLCDGIIHVAPSSVVRQTDMAAKETDKLMAIVLSGIARVKGDHDDR